MDSLEEIEVNLLKNINYLADEIVDSINSYIPKIVKVFLSKENYIRDHCMVRKYINKRNIENYFRTIIRQDNSFVFNQLLIENKNKWLNMKKYYYKNSIYSNYLIFLESYALENESTNCRNLLIEIIGELGLNKNRFKKKNIIKYIRWKT
jgi:hypothetical protein